MKKNFFKKLSFVLALAMIVTALAPAAGAFAAKAPKLSASTKALFLDVENKNVYDFNISNKVTGWKYLWSSSNKKVATVNSKNGVTTAVKAGKAIISVVITDKDGEEFDTLKATVYVRDNMKELTIVGPADNKLAVDATFDFNRSYVTESKRTTGSEGKVAWSVLKDGKATTDATIDANGNFVAKVAGEYTIECRAFQSSAKRTEFLKDTTKTSLVTAEATYKLTVAPSMKEAKQTTLKKFDLAFDSVMTKADVEKNLTVSYKLGTTKVKETVKGVTMSTDGKTATVEMYVNLTQNTTYVVEYPNMKAVEFVTATAKVEEVVDMAILTKTAQLSKEQKLDIALYNKNGVNIANDELVARVTVEKSANNLATVVGRSVYMYKLADVVTLTATFHTYNWKDGKEIGNVTATGDVTCVEIAKDNAGSIFGWSVQDTVAGPTNFDKPKTQVFKNTNSQIYVVLKGKDASGDDMYTANYAGYPANPTAGSGNWKFTSSNKSVLLVGETTGTVYGVAEGTAVVVVSYNDVQVGACEITVIGAKKLAMASLSTNNLVLSNAFSDATKVTFEAKDQVGDDYPATIEVTLNGTYGTNVLPTRAYVAGGFTIDAKAITAATAGTYSYTAKITDSADAGNSISLNFSVTVQNPGSLTVSYYKMESDKISYEVKSGDTINNTLAQLTVYGYNSAGVKVSKLASLANLAGYTIEVKNPDGAVVTGSAINAGQPIINGSDQIELSDAVATTVSGETRGIAKTEKTGSWLITATKANSTSVSPLSFEIKNSQPKVTVSVKKTTADNVTSVSGNEIALINECLTFTVGDKTLLAEAAWSGTDFTHVDKNLTVRKIKLYEEITTGNYVEHEVNLNGMVISVK